MSYDEIAERFRIKCNLNVINHRPDSHLYEKSRFSIGISNVDIFNRTAIKESDKYDLKGLDTGCFSYLGESLIGFNSAKFPELEGIESLRLSFDENKFIVRIETSYSTKRNEKFTIEKLIDSLNLSKWTNWYIEPEKGNSGSLDMTRGTLLCNNLIIESQINYLKDFGNAYSVNLDIAATTDEELRFIRNAIIEGQKREEQNKRDEAENSNAERKKRIEEENKVREPFKP